MGSYAHHRVTAQDTGGGVRRPPTERQAALAAKQLQYHREKLGWIQARMIENEALLRFYLTHLETDMVVLSGGFRVADEPTVARELVIEKLALKNLYEQLALPVGREVA